MNSIVHRLDVAPRHSQRYAGGIDVPFPVGRRLVLAFPRWSPGSYLIREYGRFVHDFRSWAIVDGESIDCLYKRHGSNEIHITVPEDASSIHADWLAFGHDLTVRTNHIDPSHFHMVPSATFPRVIRGSNFPEGPYIVQIDHPEDWSVSTQLVSKGTESCSTGLRSIFSAASRDALYDGVMEANATPEIPFDVGGRRFYLKLWDAGGLPLAEDRVSHLIKSMQDLFAEFHALFGEPPWDNYVVILHLTEKARGGLEHTGSQSSQMPRSSMDEGDTEGWRDLISLLSHEYVHSWNVKRLRPKTFEDYDLSIEMHTDLLWWFEGVTSWLGDMMCLRSGVWSDEDWAADLKRKLTRHHGMSGWDHQCLADSSHETWYHLYRPHPHSAETTISYYLQGEIAGMILDLELRRRTKGSVGLDDVMVDLWNLHGLHIEGDSGTGGVEPRGITEADIISSMNRLTGGRLNGAVRRLVHGLGAPDMSVWAKGMGRRLEPLENKDSVGWLGVHLNESPLRVRSFLAGSPAREALQPGDEIIAVNGRRTRNSSDLKSSLRGKVGNEILVTLSRRGGILNAEIIPSIDPMHPVMIKGKGNAIWRSFADSRR